MRLESHEETLESRLSYLIKENSSPENSPNLQTKIEDPFAEDKNNNSIDENSENDTTKITIIDYENFEDAV